VLASEAGALEGARGSDLMEALKCPKCGASLTYEPGTTNLKCRHCNSEFPIAVEDTEIRELDYEDFVSRIAQESDMHEVLNVKCSGCGAELGLDPNVVSDTCPYCATPLVMSNTVSKNEMKPHYLLPFKASAKETDDLFKRWIRGLWFAPGNLKKLARIPNGMKGIYMPYWTYDAHTTSFYTGARGEIYYEPGTVVVVRDGRQTTETRMVQKIRWYDARGTVDVNFDDVLVSGSRSLPSEYVELLEPWDVKNLTSYDERFLSGFRTESYQIGPKEGFDAAKERMRPWIHQQITADIGGDVQQIHSVETQYGNITIKYVLFPLWINSYRYGRKVYRFLVNARTGEVQGERPWSIIKIAVFTVAVLFLVFGSALLFSRPG
jgi:uncharacterized protein YbaR (Trm112 family)